MNNKSWVGFDLDGTLAHWDCWDFNQFCIGEPILPMVNKLKEYLDNGIRCKIFTARGSNEDSLEQYPLIRQWCLENIGQELEITNVKDYYCKCFFDDRAHSVEHNTGRIRQ